ncbi:MAG: chemotaxis protein CheR [Treponema sp.]|jgi:chemotaxis protein methyltransferase CheR|nr:chemotaxis protein CheR [Treponema sp.]
MTGNTTVTDNNAEIPVEVLSSPALLFLYYRVEQILGIRAKSEALVKLNEYLEENCGSSFIENPAAYENLLTSREKIFNIAEFLTVNETYFFREGVHFELLASMLPELAKLNRPVQICSAAASIGCEAYSIAMLLDYHVKKGLVFDFTIDAFDVDGEAIETAKNARYTANTLRNDGAAWKYILDSYLISDNGEFIVSQNIRKRVRFFPHNIMRGLGRQYDIIFFRNALIYFSSRNRLFVIDNLADSLFSGGLLFLGVSETSSVNHPLLANCYSSDVYYFQKTGGTNILQIPDYKQKEAPSPKIPFTEKRHGGNAEKPIQPKHTELPVNCTDIADILKTEEGKPNAENVMILLKDENIDSLSGSRLAAAALYYLNTQDFVSADLVLSNLEKRNTESYTRFLRGEYYFLRGIADEAERFYQEAAIKDKFFWPAFYRITVLAAEGNMTRYEYKIKKAVESIEQLQNSGQDRLNYECFLGGFSPDYFLKILEKKLTKTGGIL